MHRRLILLTALPLLAACASTAPVRTPDVALPAAFENQAQTSAAPLDRWWVAFDDPQLTALVEEALVSAPQAETALARLEEARATRLANIRSAWPQGSLALNATRRGTNLVSGPSSPFAPRSTESTTESANFDVSWEADIWGKTRIARSGVEADFAAKVFNIESARASLAANVADSLFAARGLQRQLDDAKESARIARETQRIAQIRANRGLIAKSDAERTAADVAQADAGVVQLTAELNAAKRSLLVLIGHGTDPVESLDLTLTDGAPPPPPETVPGALLERRPDVREAEERLYTAIAQLKVDRRNLFPRFTIMPGAGLTQSQSVGVVADSSSPAGFSIQPSTTVSSNWSLGVGLNVPVLNRPQLLATARASGARAEEAVIAYESAVQQAYGEAENALVQLQSDRQRLALLEAGEKQARIAYDAAKTRYDAGLDDLTSLLQAEQIWRSARSQATAAYTQAMRRSVQTFKALGGGWSPGDDFKV